MRHTAFICGIRFLSSTSSFGQKFFCQMNKVFFCFADISPFSSKGGTHPGLFFSDGEVSDRGAWNYIGLGKKGRGHLVVGHVKSSNTAGGFKQNPWLNFCFGKQIIDHIPQTGFVAYKNDGHIFQKLKIYGRECFPASFSCHARKGIFQRNT